MKKPLAVETGTQSIVDLLADKYGGPLALHAHCLKGAPPAGGLLGSLL